MITRIHLQRCLIYTIVSLDSIILFSSTENEKLNQLKNVWNNAILNENFYKGHPKILVNLEFAKKSELTLKIRKELQIQNFSKSGLKYLSSTFNNMFIVEVWFNSNNEVSTIAMYPNFESIKKSKVKDYFALYSASLPGYFSMINPDFTPLGVEYARGAIGLQQIEFGQITVTNGAFISNYIVQFTRRTSNNQEVLKANLIDIDTAPNWVINSLPRVDGFKLCVLDCPPSDPRLYFTKTDQYDPRTFDREDINVTLLVGIDGRLLKILEMTPWHRDLRKGRYNKKFVEEVDKAIILAKEYLEKTEFKTDTRFGFPTMYIVEGHISPPIPVGLNKGEKL